MALGRHMRVIESKNSRYKVKIFCRFYSMSAIHPQTSQHLSLPLLPYCNKHKLLGSSKLNLLKSTHNSDPHHRHEPSIIMTPIYSNIPAHGTVLDIGGSDMSTSVRDRLLAVLLDSHAPGTTPVMPDELLYNDKGLAIWAEIIFTPEFYQTADEIAILARNSTEISDYIPQGVTMVDLGAGYVDHSFTDLRKVENLLAVLEKRRSSSTYLALDISRVSLKTNIDMLTPMHKNVTCAGLWGDFNRGLSWVADLDPAIPRLFLSLGSVLFNDSWDTAVANLKRWASLMRPQDLILAGMDGHTIQNHREKIWAAYHAHPDLYAKFWSNGFAYANELLGEEYLRDEDWECCAELEDHEGRHRFFFKANKDVAIGDKTLPKGFEFEWFDSHKHDEEDVLKMCEEAGLSVIKSWHAPDSEMRKSSVLSALHCLFTGSNEC
ncbi:hypothetical protein SODALDRAFT_315560 [Sodiomyces alkalinus F11]|uniref:Histidine-specific methyltransferase SAM-dependent domain-containing protein n=1 Tax=Sodiomyces alkalinus (strain CBS 110278 / VKM F-3762 / F11) TaxID=1314773 RepID=A0A3N2PPZ9_SODAK|nr:hypothetical protein SODALDRAFT_315560 [Sodiomyces alkalinus F11]ROT36575.1 hypothetical protein SODALDRAFT_315560 [Sodiomyces alkalinus F11]